MTFTFRAESRPRRRSSINVKEDSSTNKKSVKYEQRIRPIPTKYKGITFRSKLEAQWAKRFDLSGIPYLYEPEGYKLSDGTCYLPDFYLPDEKGFFEVKGLLGTIDIDKIDKFMKEIRIHVTIGMPDGKFIACAYNPEFNCDVDEPWLGNEWTSGVYKCPYCDKVFFSSTEGIWKCRNCGEYDKYFSYVYKEKDKEFPLVSWEECFIDIKPKHSTWGKNYD